jgi:hypothetical protein
MAKELNLKPRKSGMKVVRAKREEKQSRTGTASEPNAELLELLEEDRLHSLLGRDMEPRKR